MGSEYQEPPLPAQVELGYPAAIRSLQTPLDALAFEGASPYGSRLDSAFGSRQSTPASDSLSPEVLGPPPAVSKRDFKLPDPDIDAFLEISEMAGEFDRHNQRLRRSSEHRLLYHAVWRQPVHNRVQAEAVLISGGDRYGQHHELEGSVMLSFNVNRIDVDTRLWVATFRQDRQARQMSQFDNNRRSIRADLAEREAQALLGLPDLREQGGMADTAAFSLPAVPITSATSISGSSSSSAQGRNERHSLADAYRVTELGYMEQRRSMVSNQLHYLDHPDFGILIELRPYQLPDSLTMDSPLD